MGIIGRDHVPGASLTLNFENVVIVRSRVCFWVVADVEMHTMERLSKRNKTVVATNDIS